MDVKKEVDEVSSVFSQHTTEVRIILFVKGLDFIKIMFMFVRLKK